MSTLGLVWVVGRGGLIGGAVGRALASHEQFAWPIEWTADDLDTQLDEATAEFVAAAGGRPWSVAWCAGAGIIGTSLATLERETASIERLLNGLRGAAPGRLFLASSAGGVHAGTTNMPVSEASAPEPLADYGHNKLRQEGLVARWSAMSGHRAAVGRIANVYGPDQSLTKAQGLISQICRSTLLRRPVTIYVPLDTIRDYVHADDCGRLIVAMLERLTDEPPGVTVVKIVASRRSISIAGVLAEARRVLRRRPMVVMASSPSRQLHGATLVFESRVWPDLDDVPHTTLPAGIASVASAIRARLAHGAIR